MKRNERGITLIALVITIIVLLILAGVSIATLTGDNGILTQAQTAKEEITYEGAKESVQAETAGSFDENGKYQVEKAVNNLNNNLKIAEQDITDNEDGTLIVKYQGYRFYVDEYGKVTDEPIGGPTDDELGIKAVDISSNPTAYYGKVISNYTCDNTAAVSNWKIFHADENNIYLIADDYIDKQYAPAGKGNTPVTSLDTVYQIVVSNVINDYAGSSDIISNTNVSSLLSWAKSYPSSQYMNIKISAYMLDTNAWEGFKGDNADYAIGGPTLDLFCESYNKVYKEKTIQYTNAAYGYQVKWNTDSYSNTITEVNSYDNLYIIASTTKARAMRLASPSNALPGTTMMAYYDKNTVGHVSSDQQFKNVGLRPVVCLSDKVELEKVDDNTYKIKE